MLLILRSPDTTARHALYKVPATSIEYIHAEWISGFERLGVFAALLHDHGRWAEERIFGGPWRGGMHARFPGSATDVVCAGYLGRNPSAKVIYDVKCTGKLAAWMRQHGGEPLMWKTGHSLVKAKLKEMGAPIAGEMIGHVFFKDRW